MRKRELLLGLAAIAFSASRAALAAPEEIGTAELVIADVRAELADENRQLVRTDPVHDGESVNTGRASASEITFIDGTQIAIGEQARVTLDDFIYQPNGAGGRMLLSAALGTFRFVTGSMAKSAYSIRTPSATISVRGTVFSVRVREDGSTMIEVEEGEIDVAGSNGDVTTVAAGQSRYFAPAGSTSAGSTSAGTSSSAIGPDDLATLHDEIAAMDKTLSAAAAQNGSSADLGRVLGALRPDITGNQADESSTPGANPASPNPTSPNPTSPNPTSSNPSGADPSGKGKPSQDKSGKGKGPDPKGQKS